MGEGGQRVGADDGSRGEALPGAVATSHPLAVEAGLDVLRAGGNAVDAAVCAAAVLGVVEPMSTGVGGDCFALTWKPGQGVEPQPPRGLNGRGRAPAAASLADLASRGLHSMPEHGVLPVTVPGALDAWQTLVSEEGTRPLGELLAPAIRLAHDGFEVTPVVARDWAASEDRLKRGQGTRAWLLDGRAPRVGERFRQSELARTLERVAADGVEVFYRGEIAEAIVRTSQRLGGWLAAEDLATHRSEWVEPLEGSYRGHPVYELPPNGQGIIALQALGIMDGYPLGDVDEVERHHLMIEAVKLAFADGERHVGDPDHLRVDPRRLLREEHLESRRAQIGSAALVHARSGPVASDTVYVATVDTHGGCCSLINSIYMHFGSHVVAEGTGVTLQNRGALFRTEPDHPSALGPGRRPYHTIIPAMVFRQDWPWLVFGVVGGFQQPQAQVQVLSNLVDRRMEPVEAVAARRFRWVEGARVRLEEGTADAVVDGLRARGHALVQGEGHGGFGGAQLLRLDRETGRRDGASDPRKDGCVGRTDARR